MIVGDYFHGDSDRIGWIQHDSYGKALRIIIDFAIDKHRHAERVVDVRTELSDLRDELRGFDHRTLQTPILTTSPEKSGFHTSAFYAVQIIVCRFFSTHQSKVNSCYM